MGEFICFVVLFALAIILLIVFFDMGKSENGMVENTTVKKATNDKEDINDKEDTTVKKEYVDIENADFKTQLSSLVLTKEETEMRQEQQRQAALEEKRLRRIAYQEKVMKAEREAEFYLKLAQRIILQQAQEEKYGIGDQIVVDIPAPSHIKFCSIKSSTSARGEVFPEDEKWFDLFTEALEKKSQVYNISFEAMAEPMSILPTATEFGPFPSQVVVPGFFECRIKVQEYASGFFRCTCTVVDDSKEEAVLTNEEDLSLSPFQGELEALFAPQEEVKVVNSKKQLDPLPLSKEKTMANKEKRNPVVLDEENKRAQELENKKMRAEVEAEKFSDVVKREILKKAKAHKV